LIKISRATRREIYFALLAPKEEWMKDVMKKSQESNRSCSLGDYKPCPQAMLSLISLDGLSKDQ